MPLLITPALPSDIARKSDIANIRFPTPQPATVTVNLPPDLVKKSDLTPLLQGHATTQTKVDQLVPLLAGVPVAVGGLAIMKNIQGNTNKIPNMQTSLQNIQDKVEEGKDKATSIVVKVWDSGRKAIGLQTITVPAGQAQATALLANEAAEAQEDSHKDRADKKSRLQKIYDRLGVQKIMQAVNTILTLHNAAMLSTSLVQTIGSLMSNGLAAIGIKGDDGADLNINELVGKGIEDMLKGILGDDTYAGAKNNFLKANRIVSATANIYWTTMSLADSVRSVAEYSANNTGRIGNALKKYRVVGENAYPWMSENVTARSATQAKLDSLINGIGNVEGVAGEFDGVVSNVRSVPEQMKDLKDQRKELDDLVKGATPKPATENDPMKIESVNVTAATRKAGDIAKTAANQTEDPE
jgi:hypothetical protein